MSVCVRRREGDDIMPNLFWAVSTFPTLSFTPGFVVETRCERKNNKNKTNQQNKKQPLKLHLHFIQIVRFNHCLDDGFSTEYEEQIQWSNVGKTSPNTFFCLFADFCGHIFKC